MTEPRRIERVAAKGDGVTADGRHVAFTAPGDMVAADGTIIPGPHHVDPPCRHFARCGGCQLQHLNETALTDFVTQRVLNAAQSHGLEPEQFLPVHLSPPRSRRRATLHGLRTGKGFALGFKEQRSQRIIDIHECHVLTPSLWNIVEPLRELLARLADRKPIDVSLTQIEQGADCHIRGLEAAGPVDYEHLTQFARANHLARLTLDQGYGAQPLWEPEPAIVALSGHSVPFPPASFMQPTMDGERQLTSDVFEFLTAAENITDLFSGLGTFAFALMSAGRRITAIEASRDAHIACRQGAKGMAGQLRTAHRDLFRAPLQTSELDEFDGVVLDPPRAGARQQVAQLAQSNVVRIAYVSCNPSSWARDSKTLVDSGYRLERLRPVGQFRWSTHVELTSLFVR